MKKLNEYDKQANDFLKKTGTDIKIEFLKFDKHFADDDSKRNIFKITLSNSKGQYKFNFGSSIVDSCKEVPEIETKPLHEVYCGIKIGEGKNVNYLSVKFNATVQELHREELSLSKMAKLSLEWDSQIEQINKKVGSKYIKVNCPPFRAVYHSAMSRTRIKLYENKEYADIQQDEIVKPSEYSILACMQTYEIGSLEDFCSEFGYDTDSIKANDTYKAVLNEYTNLCTLYNGKELELLGEIQ